MVVTLESWHIFGKTWEKLNELVRQKLIDNSLPPEWLKSMPFIAGDISDFEQLAKCIEEGSSISNILKERQESDELQRHEIFSYLFNTHKSRLENGRELFEGEFDALFDV